jgi:hypothetical protein
MATPPPLLRRAAALAALLAACATAMAASPFRRPDRRVVDLVAAGSAQSEADHGYAGHDDTTGTADGRAYRQARGWMRYAVTTFDDTEVTIACTFLSSASGSFDLIVEDSVIATKRVDVTTGTPTVVELLVPFAVTKGKTSIAVMLRAHSGPTPRLHELRTIQDHNEVPLPSGVSR